MSYEVLIEKYPTIEEVIEDKSNNPTKYDLIDINQKATLRRGLLNNLCASIK